MSPKCAKVTPIELAARYNIRFGWIRTGYSNFPMDHHNSKIQAVVFDFGGVLLDWNPRYLYRKLFNGDAEAMERFLVEIGFSQWNIEQDKGRPFAEAIPELTAKFPQYSDLIKAYEQRWDESIAGPIHGTVDVLRTLKETHHYALYALSNWSTETFYRVHAQYDFLRWFETIVLSGEVKIIKPDPRIFQVLLERTGRKAEACVFIDDSATNIEVAQQLGFTTVRFESPAQLVTDLHKLNVLQ